jgi:hypothetical protein
MGGTSSATLSRAGDFLLWYAKDLKQLKYRELFQNEEIADWAERLEI